MNFWIQGEPKLLAEVLGKIDLLIINDEEARELAGISNVARAAGEIRRRFSDHRKDRPLRLVVKKGEHGALLFDGEGVILRAGLSSRRSP